MTWADGISREVPADTTQCAIYLHNSEYSFGLMTVSATMTAAPYTAEKGSRGFRVKLDMGISLKLISRKLTLTWRGRFLFRLAGSAHSTAYPLIIDGSIIQDGESSQPAQYEPIGHI